LCEVFVVQLEKEEKGRRMMMLMRVRRKENEISRVVCQIFML
jgi:hypothetical protein